MTCAIPWQSATPPQSAPRRRISRILLLASLATPMVAHGQAMWTGASSNAWSLSGNWNPASIPDTDLEDATITFGSPTIDDFLTVRNLTLSNAQLLGTDGNSLNVTGSFSWSNSQIGSAAFMLVQGAATLSGTLTNHGTLTFDSTSMTSSAGSTLDNDGLINVLTGKLTLRGGTNSGDLAALSTGTIEIGGLGYTFANGALTSGDGTYVISSTATLASALNLSMQHLLLSGTVHGGSLTITKQLDWTGGEMRSGQRTTIESGASLNLSGNTILDNRHLVNSGTVNWAGSGSLQVRNNGTFSNLGVLNVTAGNTSMVSPSAGLFFNSGTINKSVGSTSITTPINNLGTILVSSGTLTLGGGSSSGTIIVQSGAALRFAAGSVNPFDLSGAEFLTNSGTLVNAGYLKATAELLDGRSLVMDASTAGELYLTGHFSTASFTWNRGVISGPGVTATSGIIWNDPGVQWGVGGGRTLENSGTIAWSAGVWGLSASAVSVIDPDSAGTISNLSGANFNIDSSATLGLSGATDKLVVDNHGTFSVAAGQHARVYAALNSDGTIGIKNGATLNIAGGGVNSGTVQLGEDSIQILSATDTQEHTFTSAARVVSTGSGGSPRKVMLDGSTINFSGTFANTIDLQVGRSEDSPGTLIVNSSAAMNPRSLTLYSGLLHVTPGAAVSTGTTSIGPFFGGQAAIVRVDSGATFSASTYFQDGAAQLDLRGGRVVSSNPATMNGIVVGAGTIDAPSTSINASVSPGGYEDVGSIHFSGDLSLTPSTSITFKVDADNHVADKMHAAGNVDLGGDGNANGATLFVYVKGEPSQLSSSESFVIVQANANGRTGKFTIDLPDKVFAYSLLTQEQVGYFDVSYTGSQVILHNYVPEPIGLWTICSLGLLLRRRRK